MSRSASHPYIDFSVPEDRKGGRELLVGRVASIISQGAVAGQRKIGMSPLSLMQTLNALKPSG